MKFIDHFMINVKLARFKEILLEKGLPKGKNQLDIPATTQIKNICRKISVYGQFEFRNKSLTRVAFKMVFFVLWLFLSNYATEWGQINGHYMVHKPRVRSIRVGKPKSFTGLSANYGYLYVPNCDKMRLSLVLLG